MAKTYAAMWQRDGLTRRVGKLAFDGAVLRFEGAQPGIADAGDFVRAGEIVKVAVERPLGGRRGELPTIAVTLNDGVAVRIASLDGPGTLSEIMRRVTGLAVDTTAA
jgi:hypothetical protein